MIKFKKQAHFDRILYHSIDWVVTNVEIIGNQGSILKDMDVTIFPSDHFGLHMGLRWNDRISKFNFMKTLSFSGVHFEFS